MRATDGARSVLLRDVAAAAAVRTGPASASTRQAARPGAGSAAAKASAAGLGDRLWEPAKAATRLRVQHPQVAELAEARLAVRAAACRLVVPSPGNPVQPGPLMRAWRTM